MLLSIPLICRPAAGNLAVSKNIDNFQTFFDSLFGPEVLHWRSFQIFIAKETGNKFLELTFYALVPVKPLDPMHLASVFYDFVWKLQSKPDVFGQAESVFSLVKQNADKDDPLLSDVSNAAKFLTLQNGHIQWDSIETDIKQGDLSRAKRLFDEAETSRHAFHLEKDILNGALVFIHPL